MEVSVLSMHNLAKPGVPLVPSYVDRHKHSKLLSKNRKPVSTLVAMQSGKNNDYYEILSLSSRNVGFDEIKKAYKTMALHYHPDVCTPACLTKEESTRRFIELRKAYETLSDPNLRIVYDYELRLKDSSSGLRFGSRREGDHNCPREVWERQLNGLRKRSVERMRKRGLYN
ncbi:Chaperone protein dnaJ 20, chloroplastic [Sesamum alatum]|uniref:Chaperone protein dnaJ 20, chloroplastic n=1 Tax=Sesamum alatum TaxID=300844 RepID=A0AAE1XSH0_9LAMI|nr:Chaperone protein dnaJ 20, chloroplastic [Sesamum alatum]